tara:strand:- start:1726 stop:1929 length:204 start_codon:yes stop_codon:yes gene_type:complete
MTPKRIKKKVTSVKGISVEGLTPRQIKTLSEHSVHHSKSHMKFMVEQMKNGVSFTASHKAAMKKVGE